MAMLRDLDWEDLRLFLAVARAGTLSGAARKIRVSQPTLGRRVRRLEAACGQALFQRRPEGFTLTAAGSALLADAEAMDAAAARLALRRAGADPAPTGTVRIASGEWMARFFAGSAPELQAALPGIELELVAAQQYANLSRREADIALRNQMPDAGALYVRQLKGFAYAVYGSRDYVARTPATAGEARYRNCSWIGFDDSLAHMPTARWLASKREGRQPELRCSRAMLVMDGVRAGAGLGVLACVAGDEDPALQRLTPPIAELSGQPLYLVVHRELRGVPRIRTTSAAIVALMARHRARLDGKILPDLSNAPMAHNM
jgi:DNA-binding transcriptional LysR family regulator